MCRVREAIAASTVSGLETEKSGRWCSPTPKKSTPTSSAKIPSAITSRMACACDTSAPRPSSVTSPKVSIPSSTN